MSRQGLMTDAQFASLVAYLEGPKGCNFQEAPESPDGWTWQCDTKLTKTKQWLRNHKLEMQANIEVLHDRGGFCDCEVIFNVADRWDDPAF